MFVLVLLIICFFAYAEINDFLINYIGLYEMIKFDSLQDYGSNKAVKNYNQCLIFPA